MSLEKDIIKKYGAGVIVPASLVLEKPKKIVSISPRIDIGLNGGIPEGSWLIVSGPAKAGKSSTVLQLCANAQQMGKKVFYIDAEHRFKPMNATGIHNLDIEKMMLIRSTIDKQYSGEEFLSIAMDIIKDKDNAGCVLVIDSASALCPSDEIAEDVTGSKRSSTPKMLSNFVKKMAGVVPVMDTIVVVIQHLITNTSGYGAPFTEDGGVKIQYQVDTKLRCKAGKPWLDGDKQIGQTVEWQVMTSALGPPGAKIESYLRYGYGIDDITETIMLASDFGIIQKGGAWYTLPDGTKLQGSEKVYLHLKDNKDKLIDIQNKLKDFSI